MDMSIIKRKLMSVFPSSSLTTHRKFDQITETLKKIDKKSINESNLLYLMCKANEIMYIHRDTFLPYKNIHKNQEIVLIGTGPTLRQYEPIKDAIYIGVNGAYRNTNIILDYLFIQDFAGEGDGGSFFNEEIKKLQCVKFVGNYIKQVPDNSMIASQYIADYIGAKTYYVHDYMSRNIQYKIPVNIEFFPIVDNSSTIFSALQFALYTHPRKIYIVGCDCSYIHGQHFDDVKGIPMNVKVVFDNWKKMKEYIEIYFPDIEIISINPVGLKGFFTDMYTEGYIDTYKE